MSSATNSARLMAATSGPLPLTAGGEAGERSSPQRQLSEAARQRVEEQRRRWAEEDARMFRLAHEADELEAKVFAETAARRRAYIRQLEEFARTHPVEGHPVEVWGRNMNEEGIYERGVVEYHHPKKEWRYVTHRAEFDAAGNTAGVVETPAGRALRVLQFLLVEGVKYDYDFQGALDSHLNPYIAKITFSEGPRTRGVIEFNERGETYRAEFYGDDGRVIDRWHDPTNEPEEEPALPLALPKFVRIVTQPCEACRGAADDRNDAARKMDELAQEIREVADQYVRARSAARPPLVLRHGVLLDRWLALSAQFEPLHKRLMNCTRACLTEQQQEASQAQTSEPAVTQPLRETVEPRAYPQPRLERDLSLGANMFYRNRTLDLGAPALVMNADGTTRRVTFQDWQPAVSSATPANPAVQRMMSVLDDLQEVLVIADAGRPGLPMRGLRDVWRALARSLPGARRLEARGSVASTATRRGLWVAPLRPTAPQRPDAEGSPLRVIIGSLGQSTGEAFRMHFINEGSRPVKITAGSLVLEPLRQDVQKRLQSEAQKLIRKGLQSVTVNGYCLEFLRQPPPAGTIFRVADDAAQRQFMSSRSILAAARRLRNAGRLNPDSNPMAYFHATRQWAIWTKERGFDLEAYEKAFVERTKQNFEELGQNWSKEIEQAVRARVPGRWQDIQRVLAEAAEMEGRER